ncbi:MAG: pyridoxamine 5'-phosphate oxidase family protein [Campylobacteraceae bacterium]|jgi:uncharacterized pyridoxamine 5'-phosphate oxidase family protein|nr:pyridoxamine 5'-phosphate oxidase family protein [Campylobacteraceae bacterium]
MSNLSKYLEVLKQTTQIALATSTGDIPNVRIVNFIYQPQSPELLYFASDRTSPKIIEFGKNNNVAFTTVPSENAAYIRSNNAVIQKSKLSIDDVKELFIARIAGYDEALAAVGAALDVFEVRIKEATLVSGYGEPDKISF